MEKGTIDNLDKSRRWLHNHGVLEMSWDSYDKVWRWMPTETTTIFFLYGGTAILLVLKMWIL